MVYGTTEYGVVVVVSPCSPSEIPTCKTSCVQINTVYSKKKYFFDRKISNATYFLKKCLST